MISMELLTSGGVVAVIGMGTVFAVLGILWGVLELMRVIFAPKTKKEPPAEAATSASAPVVAPIAPTPVADETEDEELIAVLTAAVAASLKTSTYNLRIKSYRQISSNTPVWNSVSRRENIQ